MRVISLKKVLKAIDSSLIEHLQGDSGKFKIFKSRYLGARRRARYVVRQEVQPQVKKKKKFYRDTSKYFLKTIFIN